MKTYCKLFTIVYLALLAIVAISCSDDRNEPGKKTEPVEGEAYFSITVRGASRTGTRAINYDTGTAEESYVHKIRVVLYDPAHTAAYTFDFTDLHSGPTQDFQGDDIVSGNAKKFTTVAKGVKKQNYKMLVVLNPTTEIEGVTDVGSRYSDFQTIATITEVKKLTGENYDSFVMTNWQGLVDVDKDSDLFDSDTDAEADPVEVYVDRSVAKVIVVTPVVPPSRSVPHYEYEVLGWNLDVINTKTYWMREPWLAVTPGTGATGPESSNTDDRYLNYAKDPNAVRGQDGSGWHSYQAWLANDGNEANKPAFKNADFTYIDSNMSGTWPAAKPSTEPDPNVIYVVENTMEAEQQYRDVTTSAIIKAKFTPLQSSISGTENMTASDPYFAYYIGKNRYVFLASELEAEYQWQESNPAGNPTSQQYQDPQIQAFMEKIGEYRALLGTNTSFEDYATDAFESKELQYDFSFFDAGHVNYYRIPIRHYEDSEQPTLMAYGRFGVVRNNIYLLTIKDIQGPGAVSVKPFPDVPPVTPPGPEEPEGPDEEEEGWISADIEILEWVVRNHEVVAGE